GNAGPFRTVLAQQRRNGKRRRIGPAQSLKNVANDWHAGGNWVTVPIEIGDSAIRRALGIRTEVGSYVEPTEMRGQGQTWRSTYPSFSQERPAERPSAEKVELLGGTPTISLGQPVH